MAISGDRYEPPAAFEAEPETSLDVARWIDAVRRRWPVAVVVAGLVLAASLVHYAMSPRLYRSVTTIQLERTSAVPLKFESFTSGWDVFWDLESFVPTQLELLKSRGLAERVVEDLRLAEDASFNPARAALIGQPAASAEEDARLQARLAQRLLAGLDVQPVKKTRLIRLAYTCGDPALAARVANGVAQAFIDWGVDTRGARARRISVFLTSQIEALKREVADKESQLNAYGERTDIVALDPAANVTLQRLGALNTDYSTAMADRINKEARYRHLTEGADDTVAESLSDGLVTQLRGDVLRLEREYAARLATYKPEWPAMQDLRAEIERSRQNLQKVIGDTLQTAREEAKNAFDMARRREQALVAELERQKGEAMKLNSAAVEYNNLKLEVAARRTLLDDLLKRKSEAEVATRLESSRETNVVIVDRALAPESPYRPSLLRSIQLGGLLGVMLGIGSVFGLELLDRTLKTPDDVERVLALPVLGVIPDVAAGNGGRLPGIRRRRGTAQAGGDKIERIAALRPRLAASEAYRSLRTALLLSSAEPIRSVLITSPGAGEGKTATAGNLAITLAQLGRRTVLVDCDMRRPQHDAIFGVAGRPGLVSVLTWQAEIDEVVYAVSPEGLYLLPVGPVPPNPAELIGSERMAELLAQLRERFDMVVVDSPPVLAVTDASILASLTDAVTVCLGSRTVTRADARSALDRLALVNAHVVGAVLNRFHDTTSNYYRHYDAYQERSRNGDGRTSRSA